MTEPTRISSWHYWVINLLLLVTAVLLAYGLVMPLITFKQLIFFKNTFSVLSGVQALYVEKQYFLFFIVMLFSIVVPIFKLVLLLVNWNFPAPSQKIRSRILWLSTVLARWSMLDVFAVALFVVMMKIDLIAEVQTHRGLIIFTIAVLSLMLLTTYIRYSLNRQLTNSK